MIAHMGWDDESTFISPIHFLHLCSIKKMIATTTATARPKSQ
jgi:hypothetical protein